MNSFTVAVAVAIFIAITMLVAIIAIIWVAMRSHRTTHLKSRFGPEYRRVARAEGDAVQAEHRLLAREKRVHKLDIQPLTQTQKTQFANAWEHAQAEFVDDPAAAVTHANVLVQEVMSVRGYPVAEFEQRVAVVSVDHPAVAQNYRLAHEIADRNERDKVGLQKLRGAMLHYRALFADLLHDGGLSPVRHVRRVA